MTSIEEALARGDFVYVLLDDGTAEITACYSRGENLKIPSELDGHTVTSIKKLLCSSGVTSVVIPDSVRNIGDSAFSGFSSLTSIVIPDGVPSIGNSTFYLCSSLTSIVIPDSVTSIGSEAFSFCEGLTTIDIPDSITSIGDGVFSHCSGLTDIAIPDSVERIGSNPFTSCDKLTSIIVSIDHPYLATIDGVLFSKKDKRLVCYPCSFTKDSYEIPKGIRIIGRMSFFQCKNLGSIVIPDTVTSIGDFAFAICERLSTIVIPDSVTSIGNGTFTGCPNLTATVGRNSYAKQYCSKNNIKYTYPDVNDWLLN